MVIDKNVLPLQHDNLFFIPMRKYILLFTLLISLSFSSCKDENEIFYMDYPLAGNSYRPLRPKGCHNRYFFSKTGTCVVDHYIDDTYIGNIDNYYYWMQGDSIFFDTDHKRDDKILKGYYYKIDFITIEDKNFWLFYD